MIEFVQGDLFEHAAEIRVNAVNCRGVMGAGIALAFRKRHPEMYKAYRQTCREGALRPGKLHVWRSGGDWIINFPTKRDWKDPSSYEDIEAGLDALREYLADKKGVSVALPALGCGRGGLDWATVSALVREKLEGLEARIYVFEPAAQETEGGQARR